MDIETLNALYEYIDEIKNSEKYIKYKGLEKRIMSEKALLVKEFNDAKEEYDRAITYGEYYPGNENVKKKFQEAKVKLYSDELMVLYKNTEMEIDMILNELKKKVVDIIKGEEND